MLVAFLGLRPDARGAPGLVPLRHGDRIPPEGPCRSGAWRKHQVPEEASCDVDLLCAFCDAELGNDLDRCQACRRGQPVAASEPEAAASTASGSGAGRPLVLVGIVLWILGLLVPLLGFVGVGLVFLGVLMEMSDLRSRLDALDGS